MVVKSIAWIAASFVAFAVVHSLTAGISLPMWLKGRVDPRLVDGWYRLAYNAFSVVTFAPMLLVVSTLPDGVVYSAGQTLAIALRIVQVLALGGFFWALWAIDFWRFAGLRQAWAYVVGEPLPLPEEALQRQGIYALMRHPLYVFSLLVLWANPTMTLNGLIFNVCTALYFVVGGAVEERRMKRAYGEVYSSYQRDVSWLFSSPRRR